MMNEKKASSSFLLLLALNTMVYVCGCLYAPFLSAYYTQHGLTASQIGLIATIGPLFSIFVQPFWARRSDASGKPKLYIMLMCGGTIAGLLSYYLGTSFPSFLFAAAFLAVFSTSLFPMMDAIVIRNANKGGFDFAHIRMGGTVGYAIVVLLVGFVLQRYPAAQFAIASIGYLILILLISRLPASENHQPVLVKQREKLSFSLGELFEGGEVLFVLVLAFIYQFGASFLSSFIGTQVVRLGYGQTQVGILNCIQAASEIPVLLFIGRVQKKIRPVALISLATILMGFRLITASGGTLGWLYFTQSMQGLTYMVVHYCAALYVAAHAKTGKSAQCQSVLYLVQTGLASVLANILGGRMIDAFGIEPSYRWVGVGVMLLAAVILLALRVRWQKEQA